MVSYQYALNIKQSFENKDNDIDKDKVKEFQKIRFYDALTASGLRALRFRQEIPDELINKVVGCDLSE